MHRGCAFSSESSALEDSFDEPAGTKASCRRTKFTADHAGLTLLPPKGETPIATAGSGNPHNPGHGRVNFGAPVGHQTEEFGVHFGDFGGLNTFDDAWGMWVTSLIEIGSFKPIAGVYVRRPCCQYS